MSAASPEPTTRDLAVRLGQSPRPRPARGRARGTWRATTGAGTAAGPTSATHGSNELGEEEVVLRLLGHAPVRRRVRGDPRRAPPGRRLGRPAARASSRGGRSGAATRRRRSSVSSRWRWTPPPGLMRGSKRESSTWRTPERRVEHHAGWRRGGRRRRRRSRRARRRPPDRPRRTGRPRCTRAWRSARPRAPPTSRSRARARRARGTSARGRRRRASARGRRRGAPRARATAQSQRPKPSNCFVAHSVGRLLALGRVARVRVLAGPDPLLAREQHARAPVEERLGALDLAHAAHRVRDERAVAEPREAVGLEVGAGQVRARARLAVA